MRRDTARHSAIRISHALARQAARAAALIDADAVAAELAKLAAEHAGREHELRTAVAQRLKSALAEGRARRRDSCC